MITQKLENSQSQKFAKQYRGTLVYKQEFGYKLVTMLIDLCTCDERSSVITRLGNFDLEERAEHIPASVPLIAIDFYNFPATDGTEIELTIKSQGKEQTARFIVDANGIQKQPSFLWLDVLKAGESQEGEA